MPLSTATPSSTSSTHSELPRRHSSCSARYPRSGSGRLPQRGRLPTTSSLVCGACGGPVSAAQLSNSSEAHILTLYFSLHRTLHHVHAHDPPASSCARQGFLGLQARSRYHQQEASGTGQEVKVNRDACMRTWRLGVKESELLWTLLGVKAAQAGLGGRSEVPLFQSI